MAGRIPLESDGWGGIFAKPMRPITFWGMWLAFGPMTLLFGFFLFQLIREPFALRALVPIVILGAGVSKLVGLLVRVTRQYLAPQRPGEPTAGRGSE